MKNSEDNYDPRVPKLESKIDENYIRIHELESSNEEYRVTYSKMDGQIRALTKRVQELTKKLHLKDSKISQLKEQSKKLQAEKIKLSEKWIRLSSKNKNEDKLKDKIKDLESSIVIKDREIMGLYEKLQDSELQKLQSNLILIVCRQWTQQRGGGKS